MATAALLDRAALAKTAEWRNVDRQTLRAKIIPRDRPAVLKGLIKHWPIVRASAESDAALSDYIRTGDLGRPIRILIGKPDIKGVYFFRDDFQTGGAGDLVPTAADPHPYAADQVADEADADPIEGTDSAAVVACALRQPLYVG